MLWIVFSVYCLVFQRSFFPSSTECVFVKVLHQCWSNIDRLWNPSLPDKANLIVENIGVFFALPVFYSTESPPPSFALVPLILPQGRNFGSQETYVACFCFFYCTGWTVIHGRVILVPCKKWQNTVAYTGQCTFYQNNTVMCIWSGCTVVFTLYLVGRHKKSSLYVKFTQCKY